MFKKVLSVVLIGVLCIGLVGCSSKSESVGNVNSANSNKGMDLNQQNGGNYFEYYCGSKEVNGKKIPYVGCRPMSGKSLKFKDVIIEVEVWQFNDEKRADYKLIEPVKIKVDENGEGQSDSTYANPDIGGKARYKVKSISGKVFK